MGGGGDGTTLHIIKWRMPLTEQGRALFGTSELVVRATSRNSRQYKIT